MMWATRFLLVLLVWLNTAFADDEYAAAKLSTASWADVRQNFPNISHETVKQVYPYLLPDDHPIKSRLDWFFSQFRVTEDEESLKKANFTSTSVRYYSEVVVTTHPLFEGYAFKISLDSVDRPNYIKKFVSRAKGSRAVRNYIEKTKTQDLFTAPRKWIYLLPPVASKYIAKDCLLIAEEIDILSLEESTELWQSPSLPTSTLDAVAKILQELGLSDSIGPHNIPFTRDNKIAFIDTDGIYWWPTPSRFPILGNYLSPENKEYWLSLLLQDTAP